MQNIDPKSMQIVLTGFLETSTPKFMENLWRYLLSAQANDGIPPEIVAQRKAELQSKKLEEARRLAERKRQQDAFEQAQKAREELEKSLQKVRSTSVAVIRKWTDA